jgi:sulfite exporter TauE/SafE
VSFGFINSIVFVFCCFLYLFKCVSSLSVVAVSSDVFYTLSFCLRTLRTMSRFGWGERVVVDIKKIKLTTVFSIITTICKLVVTRMAE